jgi:hypothetical protein
MGGLPLCRVRDCLYSSILAPAQAIVLCFKASRIDAVYQAVITC